MDEINLNLHISCYLVTGNNRYHSTNCLVERRLHCSCIYNDNNNNNSYDYYYYYYFYYTSLLHSPSSIHSTLLIPFSLIPIVTFASTKFGVFIYFSEFLFEVAFLHSFFANDHTSSTVCTVFYFSNTEFVIFIFSLISLFVIFF